MKTKKIFLGLTLFLSTVVFSQVGMGTNSPHSGAVLDLVAKDKGFLPPRVASTAAVINPTDGMLVYDISSSCIKFYEGNTWTDCLSGKAPLTPLIVNCSSNAFEGSYGSGIAMTVSNKFSVTITNYSSQNALLTFMGSDLVLGGVTGISVASVSPSSVTLNVGQSQLMEYTLSGVPASAGTLTGTWEKSGLKCVKTVNVITP